MCPYIISSLSHVLFSTLFYLVTSLSVLRMSALRRTDPMRRTKEKLSGRPLNLTVHRSGSAQTPPGVVTLGLRKCNDKPKPNKLRIMTIPPPVESMHVTFYLVLTFV